MLVRNGSQGSDVARVQRELQAAGFSPQGIDGAFGKNTLAAVKAYQRKYGLEVDGVVGPKTWAKMQTDGFEPAANSTPVPSPSRPTSAKVERMLDEARSHLGFQEGAGNRNPFSTALGRPAEAWCADFVSYVGRQAGFTVNTASAQGVANALQAKGTWKGRNNPQPGDAVTFRWDGSGGWADHVGLVEKVFQQNGRTYIQTIEGNSGDQVRRRTYPADSAVINGFGRMA